MEITKDNYAEKESQIISDIANVNSFFKNFIHKVRFCEF